MKAAVLLMRGAALLVLFALPAFAQDDLDYNVLSHRMLNTSNDPFGYYVDGRMQQPNTVLIGQVQTAVDAAYQTWESLACAYPAFTSLGLTSNQPQITDPRDPYDAFNVTAIWVTDKNDPFYDFALAGGVASAASLPLSYAGTLYQCDIYLNAVDYKWSTLTPTPSDALDLQSLVLHEIGHCMGLGHSEALDDVMFGAHEYGAQRRTLTQRDKDKACAVFPQTGAVGSPCSTTPDCQKASLQCVKPPLPDGGTGPSMCSKACQTGVPGGCDDPFVCKPFAFDAGTGTNGACLPSRGDFVTQVGAPCKTQDQCGSPTGICQPEDELPSGFPAWQGGYCTQNCATGQPPCPAGAECVQFDATNFRCLKTCRLGTGDCRMGYSCLRIDDALNLCVPTCHSNADCGGGGSVCRSCDGTCVAAQNTQGQIGDRCQSATQCGPGQVCLLLGADAGTGVCSQSCATAACACPAGSSCHALANGDRYCFKDCTVHSACGPGLQCGQLASGRACVAQCTTNNECAVGTTCSGGYCTVPGADGGTCELCAPDGGTTPVRPTPDAGTQPPSSGGCGCRSDGATGGLLIAIAAALFSLRARRRSPSP